VSKPRFGPRIRVLTPFRALEAAANRLRSPARSGIARARVKQELALLLELQPVRTEQPLGSTRRTDILKPLTHSASAGRRRSRSPARNRVVVVSGALEPERVLVAGVAAIVNRETERTLIRAGSQTLPRLFDSADLQRDLISEPHALSMSFAARQGRAAYQADLRPRS
jgi:hypothetical protein